MVKHWPSEGREAWVDIYKSTEIQWGRAYWHISKDRLVSRADHHDEIFMVGFYNTIGHKMNVLIRPFVWYDGSKRLEEKQSEDVFQVFSWKPLALHSLFESKEYSDKKRRITPIRMKVHETTFEQVKFLIRMEGIRLSDTEEYQKNLDTINTNRVEVYNELLRLIASSADFKDSENIKRMHREELTPLE